MEPLKLVLIKIKLLSIYVLLVVVETHGHRHQRQQHGNNRRSRDKKIANVVRDQLNIISSPIISSETPDYNEAMTDDEGNNEYKNMIQDHIGSNAKWRIAGKQSTSSTLLDISSQLDKNKQRKILVEEEITQNEGSGEEDEHSHHVCKTTSFSSSTQQCTKAGIPEKQRKKICAKGDAICIPSNYSKFDLPNELERTVVRLYYKWVVIQPVARN